MTAPADPFAPLTDAERSAAEEQQSAATRAASQRMPRAIVDVYPYTDEQGETLFETVRFSPKGFAQRRPDGRGGVAWNLQGVRLVLYRLPELLDAVAAGDPVYVVEGEKDADAVHAAGGVATCNPMGAGKWRDEYAEHMRGAPDVRVVAHRDEPGRAQAVRAAASLRAVGALVRIFEAAEGNDAWDHLAAGKTLDELVEIALDVPAEEPMPAEPVGQTEAAGADVAGGVREACTVTARGGTESRDAGGFAWEPPVEFSAETHGPEVPIGEFPEPIARYCEELAAVHRVPLDFLAASALAVLAGASAKRFDVAIGRTHTDTLNLYMLPVLPSGERKSVMRHLLRPLEEEERRLADEARRTILDAESRWQAMDARVKHLRSVAAKEDNETERERGCDEAARLELEKPFIPAAPRLLMDDATPEAMVRLLAQQGGRMMAASEEGGSFFDVLLGRYREGVPDLDSVLKAYDGATMYVDRATRGASPGTGRSTLSTAGVSVARPALTLLLTAQPALLGKLAAAPELKDRGFLARLAVILPPSLVGQRFYRDCAPDPSLVSAYAATLRAILALPLPEGGAEPLLLRISGAALTRWTENHDRLEREQGPDGPLSGVVEWASKQASRAARIAALFHLAEHAGKGKAALPLEIAEQTVSRAIAVSGWLEAHALVAFGRMGASPETTLAQRVLGWLRRAAPRGSFTVRDVQQAHRNVERRADLLAALDVLAERGFVQWMKPAEKRGPGRRPSEAYSVNPHTYRRNTRNPQKAPAAPGAPDSEDSEHCSVRERACGLPNPGAAEEDLG